MQDKCYNPLRVATISFFFILVVVFFLRELLSPDVWLHLGAGKYIIENFKIPTHDIFSHTISGRMWIDHEWLFQVITHFIYAKFGVNALVILRSLIFITIFILLFKIGHKGNNPIISITCLLPVLILTQARLYVHPDIFTLLFTASFLFILHKYKSKKLLYLLIPIQLLWVNMHGYYLIGFFIVFAYVLGEVLARLINLLSKTKRKETLNKDEFRRLVFVTFLLIAACFANPYTYKTLFYSVKTFFHFVAHSEFLTVYIKELQRPLAPDFKYPLGLWYRALVLISALLILVNIKKINLGQYIIYIAFFIMSVSANRHIALFSLIAGTTMICNIDDILPSLHSIKITGKIVKYKRIIENTICLLLIIFMLPIIITRASTKYYIDGVSFKNINFGISKTLCPKGIVGFINENNIGRNLFNNFDIGSYLIGNTYPQCRVFVDGRIELYGIDFMREYIKIMQGTEPFEDIAKAHDINYIVLSISGASPDFLQKIYKNRKWKLIYFDGIAVIFAKDVEENRGLIKNHELKLAEPKLALSASEIDYLRRKKPYPFFHLARSSFYRDIGLYEFAIKEVECALTITPDNAESYYLLSTIHIRKKAYQMAIRIGNEAIKRGYDNERIRNSLGAAYARLEQFDQAIEEYEKALKFNPKYLMAKQNLSNCREIKKIHKNTFYELNKKIAKTKNNMEKANMHYKAAEDLYSLKCFLSTITQLNITLKLSPDFQDNIKLHNMLGASFAQLGAYEKAITEFKKALSLDPKNALTLYNVGCLYKDKGDYDKAGKFWRKALRMEPNYKLAQEALKKLL